MNGILGPALLFFHSLGNNANNSQSPCTLRGCSFIGSLARTCTVSMLESSQVSRSISSLPLLFVAGWAVITDASRRDKRRKLERSPAFQPCVCVCVVTPAQCTWACIMRVIEIKQGQKQVQRSRAVLWASALKASPAAHSLFLSSLRLSDCQHLFFLLSSSLSISPSPPASHVSFPPSTSLPLSLCNCCRSWAQRNKDPSDFAADQKKTKE